MPVSRLRGKEILITAGANRAPIDAVRYISNRSSGRLGTEIAIECLNRGAFVTYLHGTGSFTPEGWLRETGHDSPSLANLEMIEVETLFNLVDTMEHLVKEGAFDVAIHAMAVLDYIPDSPTTTKTKSGQTEWNIKLIQAPKVISMFKKISPETLLVGFKMEVGASPEELKKSADEVAAANQCEIMVANDLNAIHGAQHVAHVYRPDKEGSWDAGRAEGKRQIAQRLCDELDSYLSEKEGA